MNIAFEFVYSFLQESFKCYEFDRLRLVLCLLFRGFTYTRKYIAFDLTDKWVLVALFFSFYFSLKFTCPSVLQSGQSSSEFRWIKSPLFLALLCLPIWIFFRLYSFLQNCLCFVVDCGWLISFLLGYLQVLVWKCWKNFLFLCLCFLVHELCERTD